MVIELGSVIYFGISELKTFILKTKEMEFGISTFPKDEHFEKQDIEIQTFILNN